MRIINWNVGRPGIKSSKNEIRIKRLRDLSPDVAILTETSTSVDLGLGYSGFFTKPSPRKPRKGEAVATVWVCNDTFTVVQTIETSDPREAICVELKSASTSYLVYGSIIPYHGSKGSDGKSIRWQEHKNAIQWHRQDWLALRRSFPKHHVIAGGDYNQHRDGIGQYGTKEVRQLLTTAIADANLVCVTEADFVTDGLSRRNLDHVCLSPDLASAVQDVHAWEGIFDGIRLSDHNGITVDIIRRFKSEVQHSVS